MELNVIQAVKKKSGCSLIQAKRSVNLAIQYLKQNDKSISFKSVYDIALDYIWSDQMGEIMSKIL